jgi:hypothetical protein
MVYGSHHEGLEPAYTDLPMDVGPAWCPDHIMLEYSDGVPAGNNLTAISPIASTDELAKQTEWWTELMNDDWKDIADTTGGAKAQPQVCWLILPFWQVNLRCSSLTYKLCSCTKINKMSSLGLV